MIFSSEFNRKINVNGLRQREQIIFEQGERKAASWELFVKAKLFGLSELSKFIESNINDIQVNTDNSNLYIVFTTSSKSTFLVYFNF